MIFYFRMSIKREKRIPTNFTAHFKYAVILTRKQPKFFEGLKGNFLFILRFNSKYFKFHSTIVHYWPFLSVTKVFYDQHLPWPGTIKIRVYFWSIFYDIDFQGLLWSGYESRVYFTILISKVYYDQGMSPGSIYDIDFLGLL